MALLRWHSRYSAGVKALDDEHKVLIATLNELHAAMMKGKGKSVANPILKRLLEYTSSHFATEERLMSSCGFAGLAEHRTRHEKLTNQVVEYLGRHQKSEGDMYIPLLHFLRDWFRVHIMQEDQEYGPWLNRHGIN